MLFLAKTMKHMYDLRMLFLDLQKMLRLLLMENLLDRRNQVE